MMQMNGLSKISYFVSQYTTFFLLNLLSSALFVIAGKITRIQMFANESLGPLLILLLIWGFSQNSLVFLFASIFNKSRIALVIVFMIVLCGVIISLVIQQIFSKGQIPYAYFVWPPFAFYRILQLFNEASYVTSLRPYTISQLIPGDEAYVGMVFLIVEAILFLLLSFYLVSVLPSEFGVPRPWHYPVTDFYKWISGSEKKKVYAY